MDKRKIIALILVPACVFLVVVSTALLVLSAEPTGRATPESSYTLRAYADKIGLFVDSETTPIAQYDVYLALLPAEDVQQLRKGMVAGSKEEAMRLLEDLGH